jgi:hypothetical protein
VKSLRKPRRISGRIPGIAAPPGYEWRALPLRQLLGVCVCTVVTVQYESLHIQKLQSKAGPGGPKSSFPCMSCPTRVHKPNHKSKARKHPWSQFPDDTAGPLNVMTFTSGNKVHSFCKRHTESLLELCERRKREVMYFWRSSLSEEILPKQIPRHQRRVVWRLIINATVFHDCAVLQTGRSRVQFSMRSTDFSTDLILPAALWTRGRLNL